MQLLIFVIHDFLLISLMAISFYIIYAPTKIFHIAHAFSITIGGYLIYFFYEPYGIIVSMFFVILSSMLYSSIVYYLYLECTKNKKEKNKAIILSIGLYIVMTNLTSMLFGDDLKTIELVSLSIFPLYIFDGIITYHKAITMLSSIMLMIIIKLIITHTKYGLFFKALSTNAELSTIYGIDKNKNTYISIFIGTTLGILIGCLMFIDTGVTPVSGFNVFLYGMVAMIIGGNNKLLGIIAAGLLLSILQNIISYYVDDKWKDMISFFILIIFLYIKPYGITGTRIKKVSV